MWKSVGSSKNGDEVWIALMPRLLNRRRYQTMLKDVPIHYIRIAVFTGRNYITEFHQWISGNKGSYPQAFEGKLTVSVAVGDKGITNVDFPYPDDLKQLAIT